MPGESYESPKGRWIVGTRNERLKGAEQTDQARAKSQGVEALRFPEHPAQALPEPR